ncbi:VOC family protein [Hymenobacter terrenus]|uniref:VOC family protein n=1 Tax=Hymenobacter terrenus TaxID=1629124 RepID=UPI000619FDCF|nr:VOC family protein [Hymenobacter terrenus]
MTTQSFQPGINHIAIFAVDADATVSFYQQVFGSQVVQQWNKAVGEGSKGRFELPVNVRKLEVAPNTYLFIFVGAGQPLSAAQQVGNVHHFTLRVPDVDQTYQQALASGATPSAFGDLWDGAPASFETQYDGDAVMRCRIAFVEGLNGEIIELFQSVV